MTIKLNKGGAIPPTPKTIMGVAHPTAIKTGSYNMIFLGAHNFAETVPNDSSKSRTPQYVTRLFSVHASWYISLPSSSAVAYG